MRVVETVADALSGSMREATGTTGDDGSEIVLVLRLRRPGL